MYVENTRRTIPSLTSQVRLRRICLCVYGSAGYEIAVLFERVCAPSPQIKKEVDLITSEQHALRC